VSRHPLLSKLLIIAALIALMSVALTLVRVTV
jgi:hypothetical protein